jgi:hypothetical protein
MSEGQFGLPKKTEISIKTLSSQPKTGRGCPSLDLHGDVSNSLFGAFFPSFFVFVIRNNA